MRETKHFVQYNGRRMTVMDYSRLTGVPVMTVRKRIQDGRPPIDPRDAEKFGCRLEAMEKMASKGYRNGYTREEIGELYSHFAGQEDELQMLRDFTGLGTKAAEELLEELKHKRRKPA